jgi:hypothetical protein
MQRGVVPSAIERSRFEDVALLVEAIGKSGAVEVAGGVKDQLGKRACRASKAMQRSQRPASSRRAQLENYAATARAAVKRAPIEIASRVEGKSGGRAIAVIGTLKTVERF